MCAYRKVRRVNSGQRRPVRRQSDSYYDESEYPEHHQHQRQPSQSTGNVRQRHGRRKPNQYRILKKSNNTAIIVTLSIIICAILIGLIYFLSDTKLNSNEDKLISEARNIFKDDNVVFNNEFYQRVVNVIEDEKFNKKDLLTRVSVLDVLLMRLEDAFDRKVLKLDEQFNILSQEDKNTIKKGLKFSQDFFAKLSKKNDSEKDFDENKFRTELKENISSIYSEIRGFESNISLIETRCTQLRITFNKGELIFLTDVRNLLRKFRDKWNGIRDELNK